MNYLWGGMILIGIVYGMCTGNISEVTQAVIQSSKEAVNLCIGMAGITAFWNGLMKIAEESGMVEGMTIKIRPLLNFLFPGLVGEEKARKYIAVNMIANFLGLGMAATPAGLKAMEELEKIEEARRRGAISGKPRPRGEASNEMCNLLIINISSLQLVPVTMLAYRGQYGSVNPTAIIGPAIVATMVSTVAGVIYCKWKDRR